MLRSSKSIEMIIGRRLRFGFAMVILASGGMVVGLIVVSFVLDRNLWAMLFGESFLAYELLIILVVLFLLAFILSPKESGTKVANDNLPKGVEIDSVRGAVRIKRGPDCKIGLFFSLIGLSLVGFGAAGVVDSLGFSAIFDDASWVTGFTGLIFLVIGLLFLYLALGALTCWDQVEIRNSGASVCAVKFLRKQRKWVPMDAVDGLYLVKNYDDRDGEGVELFLQMKNREPLVIADSESYSAMSDLQNKIATMTGIAVGGE